ncbi:snoRNA binding protein [Ascosphaera apis ARSEF 7405]|uniref:SnoRNA binding protein n=1 Tax=Ascosphaera apis ARSEF 7405 TaxID=392613 RepID=A0A168D0F9_9EURO|nr:snoRNA binding protein [Ascosphaera apis ARSEF 7405]
MSSTSQDAFGLPHAKRQKVVVAQSSAVSQIAPRGGSRIFSPFRTLGLVSPTSVPFTSIPLGKTTFQITTSVGRSLQTYDLRKGLSLVFLTRPQTPGPISATCSWKAYVFAAWDASGLPGQSSGIWVFKRGKKVAEIPMPTDTEKIDKILVFGSWIVGCCGRRIEVWKSATFEHYTTLLPPASGLPSENNILTGAVCTMPTYLNKIFVGRVDGAVDIWNLSTGKLLYTILPAAPKSGSVTAIEPTPVLSLAAIAYSSGALTIHNISS